MMKGNNFGKPILIPYYNCTWWYRQLTKPLAYPSSTNPGSIPGMHIARVMGIQGLTKGSTVQLYLVVAGVV